MRRSLKLKRGAVQSKRIFAQSLLKAGSISKFVSQSDPNPLHTHARGLRESIVEQNLNDPVVINHLLKAWRKKGISLDLASQVHFRALTSPAKRWKGSDKLKAVEMTYRGHGIKEFAKDSDSLPTRSILQIFIDQRKERGLPLPEGVIDADSG